MRISTAQFEQIVGEAFDELPQDIREQLYNVAIIAQDFPNEDQLDKTGNENKFSLFGLYEGYVQSSRLHVGAVLPDRITLFRMPIAGSCNDLQALKQRVAATLRHEIAHHFGSDEKGARKATRTKKR